METSENLPVKRIGVLTSGGDAPGMNAAVRSIVRAAIDEGFEVFGIKDGFLGLHQDRFVSLDRACVNDIITRGGTFLGTARFTAFKEESIRAEAIENLKKHKIDALITIGGDGTYTGALRLHEMGVKCIGVPASIDNDVHGTEYRRYEAKTRQQRVPGFRDSPEIQLYAHKTRLSAGRRTDELPAAGV